MSAEVWLGMAVGAVIGAPLGLVVCHFCRRCADDESAAAAPDVQGHGLRADLALDAARGALTESRALAGRLTR